MSIADKPIDGKKETDNDRLEPIPPYEWDDEKLKAATERRRRSVRELFRVMGWKYEHRTHDK